MSKVYQEENSTFESDGVVYDLNTIWKAVKDQPILEIDVDDLKWVVADNDEPVDQKRIDATDLTAPLLVTKYDKLELVVDGFHRLQKAISTNVKKLPYRRVSAKVMQESIVEASSESFKEMRAGRPVYLKW